VRAWIAIGLGIAVLTGLFVFTQFNRDRGGEVAVPEAASPSQSGAALPETSSSTARSGDQATTSGTSSPELLESLRTSPVTAEMEQAPTMDPAVRAQNRAEGNARINAQGSGSGEPNPMPSGGGVTGPAPVVGIPETDIAAGNSQPTLSGPLPGEGGPDVVGPLPGEGEPEISGPLPGEGEPQVYGPLPGENDPQVLGPLPGEGEPELPPGPLPGEGQSAPRTTGTP
jgi:hypothetical protein